MKRLATSTIALVLLLAGRASAQTVLSTCGQEIHGFAIMNADLDCTGFAGHAVDIHGGKLDMNGHTLTGGNGGISCDGNCKIIGPGTVTASAGIGINALDSPVRVQQVDVTDHAVYGVQCGKGCTLNGPMTISGNGVGVRAGHTAKLRVVTLSGNGIGVDASNNDDRGHALLFDSTVTGNVTGVSADRLVKTSNTTVTGNSEIGVDVDDGSCSGKGLASIKGGTVTGNGTDSDCGTTVACADLATCKTPPHLAGGATCDHSYVNGSGIPGSDWDVCALD